MADKLTEKQKRFADEYLVDLNATKAYMKVYGCKETTAKVNASKLLTNTNIQEYIKTKQKKLEIKTELNAQWVLDNLKTVAERCMIPEPLVDREGNIVEYTFQAAGANKALELIGKHLGMFTDRVISENTNVNIEVPGNTPDEQIKHLVGKMSEEQKKKYGLK